MPQAPIRDSPRPRYGAGPPPYTAVEVAFQNAVDNVQLAGTLTVPRGALNAPAVLLSQGLGFEPFDRDYAVPSAPALKSFIAIADALSRNGIVVLRVDDRGAGRSSGQKQLSSVQQLAGDLVAGVAFLKTRPEVDPKRIGIIGHSFAGLTAPIAAVRSNDVAFVITLAGLMTDARVNLERLPAGLRAVTTNLDHSDSEFAHIELVRAGKQAARCVHFGDRERERPGARAHPRRDGSDRDAVGEVGAAPPVPGPYRSRGGIARVDETFPGDPWRSRPRS